MIDTKTRKKQLVKLLTDLNRQLHTIEDTLEQPVSCDSEDRATEREEDEVLERLGNSGLKEVQMIKAALVRIENETYGKCSKCGEAISKLRLDLLPFTPLCRNCAA